MKHNRRQRGWWSLRGTSAVSVLLSTALLSTDGTRVLVPLLAPMLGLSAWNISDAAEAHQGPVAKLRQLRGEELQAAREGRNQADRLSGAYRQRYGRPDAMPAGEAHAAAEVVSAYKGVMEEFKHTEIAAYCGLHLSAFHKFRGDYEAAITQAEQVAEQFAGTEWESQAFMSVGLIHMQCRRDPAAALVWFHKIPKPGGDEGNGSVPTKGYNKAEQSYLAAQLQIAKCEALLGKPADAEKRYDDMARRYPQFESSLRSTAQFQMQSASVPRVPQRVGQSGRDIRPDALLDPALTDRVQLEELLGTGSRTAQAQGAVWQHRHPPGSTSGETGPHQSDSAVRTQVAVGAGQHHDRDARSNTGFCTLASICAALSGICLSLLIWFRWRTVQKEAKT